MKYPTFAKSILACAIPAALFGFSAVAAPTDGEAKLKNSLELNQEQRLENRTTRLIVKFKSTAGAQGIQHVSAQAAKSMGHDMAVALGQDVNHARAMAVPGFHVFQLTEKLGKKQTANAIEVLMSNPAIESVEEDIMLQHMFVPNDSDYSDQWHYKNSSVGLNAEQAWDTATGAGVVVAVLDTGITNHSDLNANVLPGYDMISDTSVGNDGNGRDSDPSDPGDWITTNECGYQHSAQNSSWHGTHVAGTVAAVTNNNKGVAGVAYGAKVVPVRVLGKCGGLTSDIADAIVWASGGSVGGVPSNANPADVINLSLGGQSSCASVTQSAINTARANGATVVVAAGNSSANAGNFTPASCSGVITVAATDKTGGDSYYTNYGSVVDVAAPGGAQSFANDPNGVLSTLNSGTTTPGSENYVYYQGTSMAAPHVAGVVALMKEVDSSLTPDQIETMLKNTAKNFPSSCNQCGSGIVDAKLAVDAAGGNGGGGNPGAGDTVTHTNQSASRRSWVRNNVDIPSGMTSATFSISGGTGDADLYVRRGAEPTTSSYDCRPYLYGNNETCSFSNPQSGTWYYGVRAYSAFSGVTITASYQ